MKYNKFIVEKIVSTPSGTYARYTSANGMETLTGNFNFKEGDTVEQWDYDGYCPAKMNVNGKEVWNEQDKKNWWKAYNSK